jgi:hypothetical protein
MIAEFKEITGANLADSTRFIKKYKSLENVCPFLHKGNELIYRQLMHSSMILRLRALLLQKGIKPRKRN